MIGQNRFAGLADSWPSTESMFNVATLRFPMFFYANGESRRADKGREAVSATRNGGHASLCPPYKMHKSVRAFDGPIRL